jgi:hypothetical protein
MQTSGRSYERRLEARRRHFKKVLTAFDGILDPVNAYWEHKPQKQAVEATYYFRYNGVKFRFDYEYDIAGKLPNMGPIRNLIWDSMKDYIREHPNYMIDTYRAVDVTIRP